ADLINGVASGTPDPSVVARPNPGFSELLLTSKISGADGNNIGYSVTTSTNAVITATAASSVLSGGQNAAEVAPGTLVTIQGTNLSDTTAAGTPNSSGFYPTTLAGVSVYFDGIKAPVLFVSPTQINTQVPFEVSDASATSAFVRTVHGDGSVTTTTAIAAPIVLDNPGILAKEGSDPRQAIAYHFSSSAIAVVSVDGTVVVNDTITVGVEDRTYTYTIQASDTLSTVRDGLIALINSSADEKVVATPSQQFSRIILTAKVRGPDGNGLSISALSSTNSSIVATALNTSTCCASIAGARITPDNAAVPGEVITIYATGLGLVNGADGSPIGVTGQVYNGPAFNILSAPVDNAQVGGRTANVLNSGLLPGMIGVYQVDMQLGSDLPTNPNTQMFIAQSIFTSNIVTIPIVAPQ
ncbi:MAG TPA: IPT/TIG domain-containing protein, partial [Bryobacteraceae bacterium]|nr:IPT/TIG domain-containing protein [Bryobacteraceae bacterium]